MNHYNVTIQAAVNVRVRAVQAPTPQRAITVALGRVDLYSLLERRQHTPNVDFTEYAEEGQRGRSFHDRPPFVFQSSWSCWLTRRLKPPNI